MDFLPYCAPSLQRSLQAKPLPALYSAIERHPGHHLGVGELTSRAAYLPNSVIGLTPYFFQMLKQRPLEINPRMISWEFPVARLMQCVGEFSIYIKLEL